MRYLVPALGVAENLMQCLSPLVLIFGDKKGMAFQGSLHPYFHPWIIEVFDLPSFSSESRKRYALRLSWICLEEGWEVGSFPALGNYLLGGRVYLEGGRKKLVVFKKASQDTGSTDRGTIRGKF